MLPIFTTGQVKDGIDIGDLKIDLSDYMMKKDAATKKEVEELTAVVANKLDAEPQHKHHIEDIKQLETALASKFDTGEKYSYTTIISDIETIPYLEAPKIKILSIGDMETENSYKFYVDDSNGDLMIVLNDMLIGTYVKATNNWILGGVNMSDLNISGINDKVLEHDGMIQTNSVNITDNLGKINALTASLNEYITKTDAILKNHYDALIELCDKHGMIDSNTSDGDQITPA